MYHDMGKIQPVSGGRMRRFIVLYDADKVWFVLVLSWMGLMFAVLQYQPRTGKRERVCVCVGGAFAGEFSLEGCFWWFRFGRRGRGIWPRAKQVKGVR